MKWYVYVICFLLMLGGVFCGIRLYSLVTRQSYVNGSINIENRFSATSFSYYNTAGVPLYHSLYDTTDIYSYQNDLLPVADFNGRDKNYQVILNGYVLIESEIYAGAVSAVAHMEFYNVDGALACASVLNVSVTFFSDKTVLTISTNGAKSAGYIAQYFRDNGVRLEVVELKEGGI
jgi:hypothetical protein